MTLYADSLIFTPKNKESCSNFVALTLHFEWRAKRVAREGASERGAGKGEFVSFYTPRTHVDFSRDFSRLLKRRACSQVNLNSQSYTHLLFEMLISKPLNICNKGQCYKILVSSAAVSLHVGIYESDLFV